MSYNFNDSQIDFYSHEDGLATSDEWKELCEQIWYSRMRQMLSEDLFTSLCLDAAHCNNLINNVRPATNYNPSILNIEGKTALICVFTVSFQLLIFVFTVPRFFHDNKSE